MSEELIEASRNGDTKTALKLIEKEADVNDTNYRYTALMEAAFNGHTAQ